MESQSTNITWHEGRISRADRQKLLGQKGATLWFTGLSGSGKSTVACALEEELLRRGVNAYRLDGDNIRHGLNANLDFSPQGRAENIRRIGEVARLFADACTITITSFISPYRADRAAARALHEKAGLPFLEIHIRCPIEVAESRDPKGLYKKARAGLITGFTGIDDPYEEPLSPELELDTSRLSVDQSVARLLELLETRQLLTA